MPTTRSPSITLGLGCSMQARWIAIISLCAKYGSRVGFYESFNHESGERVTTLVHAGGRTSVLLQKIPATPQPAWNAKRPKAKPAR